MHGQELQTARFLPCGHERLLGGVGLAVLQIADQPAIPDALAAGNYATLLDWMKQNVHQKGSQLLPGELIKQATGRELSAQAHLEHLGKTYT